MPVNDSFHIYDTTLRDGAQQEGLNLSVHDKMNIARHLKAAGLVQIQKTPNFSHLPRKS